jgi:hypothetical protein
VSTLINGDPAPGGSLKEVQRFGGTTTFELICAVTWYKVGVKVEEKKEGKGKK